MFLLKQKSPLGRADRACLPGLSQLFRRRRVLYEICQGPQKISLGLRQSLNLLSMKIGLMDNTFGPEDLIEMSELCFSGTVPRLLRFLDQSSRVTLLFSLTST